MSEWQARTLDDIYPVPFLDCMVLKIRDGGTGSDGVHLALGIGVDGERDGLGMWIPRHRGR